MQTPAVQLPSMPGARAYAARHVELNSRSLPRDGDTASSLLATPSHAHDLAGIRRVDVDVVAGDRGDEPLDEAPFRANLLNPLRPAAACSRVDNTLPVPEPGFVNSVDTASPHRVA